MEKIYIEGGQRLVGEVSISGSKNASLAILAGCLLAADESVISNVPHINDVYTMIDVLTRLGAECEFVAPGEVKIDSTDLHSYRAPYDLVKRMRASFYVAAPLLARLSRTEVPLPGGCVIGSRPVNFHISGFQSLGAEVVVEHGYMKAKANRLKGTTMYLDPRWRSVGTTINMTMAASLAEGTTIIENAARDPEVVDFAEFLCKMGANIDGIGSSTLKIEGVKELHGVSHKLIPDRIEAGTFLIAGAITCGNILLKNARWEHLEALILALSQAGVEIEKTADGIRAGMHSRCQAIEEIITSPYPGFPTDLQPPLVAFLSIADETSVIHETIFDARWNYVDELRRMGADVRIIDQTALIRGVEWLSGAPVECSDIRAGAGLVLAGLAAQGETEISGVEFIDRGYERIVEKLANLSAKIKRVKTS